MRLGDLDALKKSILARLDDDEARISEIVEEEIDNAPTVPTHSQKLGCEICTNRNIKSKEACTSPFGVCEFFNDTPDRSFEIAQKSIELVRSLGRTEERAESKTSHGEWIAVKDRFPDIAGCYLVSLEDGRIVVADERSIIENHDFPPRMMAWQPLPEPYAQEGGKV